MDHLYHSQPLHGLWSWKFNVVTGAQINSKRVLLFAQIRFTHGIQIICLYLGVLIVLYVGLPTFVHSSRVSYPQVRIPVEAVPALRQDRTEDEIDVYVMGSLHGSHY